GRLAGGVLVHCYAGVSRSATAILAYMIDSFGLDVATALEHLRRSRPQANPNPGFRKQIREYEALVRTGSVRPPNGTALWANPGEVILRCAAPERFGALG
ncbi:protein-tyrosine phosphatase-like protein, partial [Baffinella frigidus]